jgi:DNA-binding response OmpR family regulator
MSLPTARGGHRTPSILVIDADNDTRTLCRQCCTLAGWEMAGASDGRDGLIKALVETPSLIVTEIALPFIDGRALCDILRRDRATANIPILVVTAESRQGPLAQVRLAGADQVLIKPVTPEHIVSEMRRLLTSRETCAGAAATAGNNASAESSEAEGNARRLHRRRDRQQSFRRHRTTLPPMPPPALVCPVCDGQLAYEHSHIGGVTEQQAEQWDDYMCGTCGAFQYRHRTRKLRPVSQGAA